MPHGAGRFQRVHPCVEVLYASATFGAAKPADERPGNATFEPGRDRPDDAEDQEQMWCRTANREVPSEGDVEQRDDGRPDRGEEETHRRRQSSAD